VGLTARGLGYTYGKGTRFAVDALRGVDLHVGRGDLLVVAGTTGSGKSTLLRLLAGLLAPTAGEVRADGDPPHARYARGRVAIVFQNPETQFFAETVHDDVAFGPRNLGVSDPSEAARLALETVGLDPAIFADRSPFALSGGEARRAAIAGALAMRCPYLLLDEPTAGLDAAGRRAVLAAVAAERRRAGIVVVTHDPDEFLVGASAVLALASGRVAYAGPVDRLLAGEPAYEEAGLRLPEVVRAQQLARERGARLDQTALGPREAARVLADAAEVRT
jgi:energy-coupling factor transport system ATP-binding protein